MLRDGWTSSRRSRSYPSRSLQPRNSRRPAATTICERRRRRRLRRSRARRTDRPRAPGRYHRPTAHRAVFDSHRFASGVPPSRTSPSGHGNCGRTSRSPTRATWRWPRHSAARCSPPTFAWRPHRICRFAHSSPSRSVVDSTTAMWTFRDGFRTLTRQPCRWSRGYRKSSDLRHRARHHRGDDRVSTGWEAMRSPISRAGVIKVQPSMNSQCSARSTAPPSWPTWLGVGRREQGTLIREGR